jgi:hypothetical protein
MREFWVSAYDQYGNQFGTTIIAANTFCMFYNFQEEYPDCEIADYGEYKY